ncbi:MAG: M24 family metallopeptidase [Bacteroidales bacterium]
MAPALTDVLAGRHLRIRASLADRQLDALVVTHLPNVFYLTNFAGSAAIVVITAERLHFITDFRYMTAVQDAWASAYGCPNAVLVPFEANYDETLVGLLRSSGLRRVGFEAARVPFAQYGRWSSGLAGVAGSTGAVAVELVPTERVVEGERLRKDAHELATIAQAADMITAAFDDVAAQVLVGRSERQVAARIDLVMKEAGFERSAFDTIVASGPNGALPHARPGARLLAQGDLVVLDFGGVYDGYCVDLTRTVSLGAPSAEARRIYGAVAEAHAAGVAASRVGATARDVDRAARGVLERLGLGDAFGHGTGHGLGIEVHEEPWIARTKADAGSDPRPGTAAPPPVALEAGMVFTVEPGAYLPGWGGVRLEDDLVVTDDGPRLLTHVPRELAVL